MKKEPKQDPVAPHERNLLPAISVPRNIILINKSDELLMKGAYRLHHLSHFPYKALDSFTIDCKRYLNVQEFISDLNTITKYKFFLPVHLLYEQKDPTVLTPREALKGIEEFLMIKTLIIKNIEVFDCDTYLYDIVFKINLKEPNSRGWKQLVIILLKNKLGKEDMAHAEKEGFEIRNASAPTKTRQYKEIKKRGIKTEYIPQNLRDELLQTLINVPDNEGLSNTELSEIALKVFKKEPKNYKQYSPLTIKRFIKELKAENKQKRS